MFPWKYLPKKNVHLEILFQTTRLRRLASGSTRQKVEQVELTNGSRGSRLVVMLVCGKWWALQHVGWDPTGGAVACGSCGSSPQRLCVTRVKPNKVYSSFIVFFLVNFHLHRWVGHGTHKNLHALSNPLFGFKALRDPLQVPCKLPKTSMQHFLFLGLTPPITK